MFHVQVSFLADISQNETCHERRFPKGVTYSPPLWLAHAPPACLCLTHNWIGRSLGNSMCNYTLSMYAYSQLPDLPVGGGPISITTDPFVVLLSFSNGTCGYVVGVLFISCQPNGKDTVT